MTPYFTTDTLPQLIATSKAVVLGTIVELAVDEGLGGPMRQVRYSMEIEETLYDPVGLIGDSRTIEYYNNTLVEDGVDTVTVMEGSTALVPGTRGYFFLTDTEIGEGRIHLVDPNSEIIISEQEKLDTNTENSLGGELEGLESVDFAQQVEQAIDLVEGGDVVPAIDPRTDQPIEVTE